MSYNFVCNIYHEINLLVIDLIIKKSSLGGKGGTTEYTEHPSIIFLRTSKRSGDPAIFKKNVAGELTEHTENSSFYRKSNIAFLPFCLPLYGFAA
jgi:hypothetical protein